MKALKLDEIQWFRLLLALHQIIYLLKFLPNPAIWFLPGEMVIPNWTYPHVVSFVHLLSVDWQVNLVWGLLVIGWIILGTGRLSKIGQLFLFFLQVSLHNANPLIIHEPQQIANFFLFFSVLWPDSQSSQTKLQMKRLMLAFLCIYYFLAGLKKLPDSLWLEGKALQILLNWQPIARNNFLVEYFLKYPTLLKLATWLTLVFELGFSFIAWSRFRLWLIPIGFIFHFSINLLLEVGSFSWIMAPWYAFLLSENKIDVVSSIQLQPKKTHLSIQNQIIQN